jgi:hypothetical protein
LDALSGKFRNKNEDVKENGDVVGLVVAAIKFLRESLSMADK